MQNALGVCLCYQDVALTDEKFSKPYEIIYFAIEDDPKGSILVRQRLMSSAKIDDAQPSKSQTDSIPHIVPFVIGSSVPD
jgi:hypothetical protein